MSQSEIERKTGRYVVTGNIEGARLAREERLAEQGWTTWAAPWHEPHSIVADLTHGLRLGADGPPPGAEDLSADMARLPGRLEPEEMACFRESGRLAAEAMDAAVRALRHGQSEHEIAGLLAHEAERRGMQAIVKLVATDERISLFRHPLPTGRCLERHACPLGPAPGPGLLRHAPGPLWPAERRATPQGGSGRTGRRDTDCRHAPGEGLAAIFRHAVNAYEAAGYPGGWQRHHQGGVAGYEPREYLATRHSTDIVCAGQAYAWNPSIAGAKSEDTILVTDAGHEVLTAIAGWPTLPVAMEGQTLLRPAVLEIL